METEENGVAASLQMGLRAESEGATPGRPREQSVGGRRVPTAYTGFPRSGGQAT